MANIAANLFGVVWVYLWLRFEFTCLQEPSHMIWFVKWDLWLGALSAWHTHCGTDDEAYIIESCASSKDHETIQLCASIFIWFSVLIKTKLKLFVTEACHCVSKMLFGESVAECRPFQGCFACWSRCFLGGGGCTLANQDVVRELL